MSAVTGLDVVDQIAVRLDEAAWPFGDGELTKPPEFPDAGSFLTRGAEGERNRLVVYLVSELPTPSRGGRGPTVQTVTAEIALVLVLPRRNDRGGEKARDRARQWLGAARMRLLAKGGSGPDMRSGWTPQGASAPLAWAGGQLEPFDDDTNHWIWVDRYRVEWTLDSQGFNGA